MIDFKADVVTAAGGAFPLTMYNNNFNYRENVEHKTIDLNIANFYIGQYTLRYLMAKKNRYVFLIFLLIILISGCAGIKDIPSGVFSEGYSQMADLNINNVKFVDATIIESGDFLKISFRYKMDVENEVKVEISNVGHPARTIGTFGSYIYYDTVFYNNQTENIYVNLIGIKEILPSKYSSIQVNNEFRLSRESIEKSGEIKVQNLFTEKADGDSNIKKIDEGVLTTIKYSTNSRTRSYEINEAKSEIITLNNPEIQINFNNL